MGRVTVSPETFTMVEFDASEIRALTERLMDQVGLPTDLALELRIDEQIPLGRVTVASTEPLVIEMDGGALEDPKRLRQFDSAGAVRVIAGLLFQASDLLNPDFGEPQERDSLSLTERVSWDTYAAGRVGRLGDSSRRQRWLYAFRTRHGFSDGVDRAFDELWSGVGLSWAEITTISANAVSSAAPAPAA